MSRDYERERADYSEICDRLDRQHRLHPTHGMTAGQTRNREATMAGPHESKREDEE
jgi:hypothetical protein